MRIIFWLVIFWLAICYLAQGQEFDDRPQTKLAPMGVQHQTSQQQPSDDPADKGVVCVTTPDGFGGSGVVVKLTEESTGAVVLTNSHVVDQNSYAFIRGRSQGQRKNIRFEVIYTDEDQDFAVMRSATCRTGEGGYTLAAFVPPVGSDMSLVGWGGGRQTTRYGKRMDVGRVMSINVVTRSGDSGGAITYNGSLVGINFGYPHAKNGSRYSDGSGSPASSHVALSSLHQTLTKLGPQYGFLPVIDDCPPGST
jgi:hypothetical protein